MTDKIIGKMLLDMELITPEQLAEASRTYNALGQDQPFEQILVKLGYVSEETLLLIRQADETRLSLAEILLKHELVPREDLEIALEMSANERLPLEKVLMNLELASEENLAKGIALNSNLPFSRLDNRIPNIKIGLAKAIAAFSPGSHSMVPVSLDGGNITIAMNRPLPLKKVQQLEAQMKLKVVTIIATESDIAMARSRLLAHQSGGSLSEKRENVDSVMELLASESNEPDIEQDAQRVAESDSVLVKLVNKIILDAYYNKASDIHIEPYPGKDDIIVRTRIDGVCSISHRLPYKYKYAIPSRIKIMGGMDIAERRKPQDGKIDFKKFGSTDLELRVASMPAVGNLEDIVIRLLQTGDPLPFDKLMLTTRNKKIIENSALKPYGLILVVGPTGSGKTTTLHSVISLINHPERKILTAEDPVEITQKGLRQLQVNSKIGLTFASALRSFLRLDPDVIMVGEMRDAETASIAIEASLTGHLVFSTLHTNTAAETVTRLLDMELDPFGFSDSLLCVVAQRLARRLCDHCKKTWRPTDSELEELGAEFGSTAFAALGISRESMLLAKPVGCDKCQNTGYKGRIGIHEVLEGSDALKNLIKKKSESAEIRCQAIAEGMTTLKQDGILKALHGITDIHEIRKVCIR